MPRSIKATTLPFLPSSQMTAEMVTRVVNRIRGGLCEGLMRSCLERFVHALEWKLEACEQCVG